MKPITFQQVRQAVGGKLLTPIPTSPVEIVAICTDTRKMAASSLFVALRGDNYDGHRFLSEAAAGGAIAALVEQEPTTRPPNMHLILVNSTRTALGKLARLVRSQLTGKVIAVGGSNGKTGTKHLIDSVLSTRLRGTFSPKSFNNNIGVPLAIFPSDPGQHYLVLEMGTNHHGELRELTNMAQPDIAVITNCSAEHLEGLDDMMGVRREEASMIEGLRPDGLLIVNGDDSELLELVARYPGKRVTFGLTTSSDLHATDIRCTLEGTRFRLNGRREVFVPLLGKHIALNALAAIAVARRLGMVEEEIVAALAKAHGPEMRLQLQTLGGITLLNDAYNANPASMAAALETLALVKHQGRRVAILGDMRELGESTDRFHRELGQLAAHQPIDRLVCVGDKAGLIAEEARLNGMPADRISHLPDTTTAARIVPEWLVDGDLVLLKASRSMKLELIGQAIGDAAGRRAAS